MEHLSYSASWPVVVSTNAGGGKLTEFGEAPPAVWSMLSSAGAHHMIYTLDSQYGTSLHVLFAGDGDAAGDKGLGQLESFHALRNKAGTSSCSAGAGRNARSGPFRVAAEEWMQRLTVEPPCLQHLGGLRRHFLPHFTHAQDVATIPPLAAALLFPSRLLRTRRFVVTVNASVEPLPPRNKTRTRRAGITEARFVLALEITLTVEGPNAALHKAKAGDALSLITADRRLLKDPRDASSVWVVLSVRNPSTAPVHIRVSEAAPPGYRALWHTHTYTRRPLPDSLNSIDSPGSGGASVAKGWVAELDSFRWWPSLAAPEGASLPSTQWALLLPPGFAVRATFSARVEMLHREAQPHDASRGSEIGAVLLQAALVDPTDNTTLPSYSMRLPRSACLTVPVGSPLLPGPFPDATMPFNVMTLVSTLLSFLIGSLINATAGRRRKAKTN